MALLTAALIASSALSVGSSIASGIGMRKAANFGTAQAAKQAADTIKRGEEDVTAYRSDLAQLLGTQRASLASAGVDVTKGSAAAIKGSTETFGKIDIARIRENARREAFGIRSQAEMNARSLRSGANASFAQAGSTLLTAGVDAYQSYKARPGAPLPPMPRLPARSSSVATAPSFGYARP